MAIELPIPLSEAQKTLKKTDSFLQYQVKVEVGSRQYFHTIFPRHVHEALDDQDRNGALLLKVQQDQRWISYQIVDDQTHQIL